MGHRLRLPAGVLVGTLIGVGVGVGVGSALLGLPQVSPPSWTNGVLQISLGMLVGFRMTREELRSGAHALIPAFLVTLIIISSGVATALTAASLTSVDVVTAVFAAAPGGLTEMSAVSLTFGADGAAVATVQLVRVLLALAIVSVVLKRFGTDKGDEESDSGQEEQGGSSSGEGTGYAEDLKRLGVAAPWGVLGGILGIISSAPAGGIVGGLVGAAAFQLISARPVPLRGFQTGVQVLAGGIIGLGVSGEFLGQLTRLAGAGALIISAQMLLWIATSWLLVRIFHYDLPTSILASTPGGLSGVLATAGEGGADVVVVTFVHLVRLSTIVVVVPVIVAVFFGG